MSDRPAWKSNLLEEDSLFSAYCLSLKFPKKCGNRVVLFIASLISIVISFAPAIYSENYDSLAPILSVLSYSTTMSAAILGFLIAGFSIFGVISSDHLMTELAQTKYDETDFSIFKIIFYNFLSAFFVFIMLLSLCGIISAFSELPIVDVLSRLNCNLDDKDIDFANALALTVFLIANVYALIKLKSFVWGVYQAFLTMMMARDLVE